MELRMLSDTEILREFKRRFEGSTLYGLGICRLLDEIGDDCVKEYIKGKNPSEKWKRVTSKDQVSVGTSLKIIGFNPRHSIKCIKVKEVIPHYGTEIILKKKENLYFNLGAYLGELETVGRWVKEIYYK